MVWQDSIARFFDGLAWPTAPALLVAGNWHNIYYPEEYDPGTSLHSISQGAAGSIFWHYLPKVSDPVREEGGGPSLRLLRAAALGVQPSGEDGGPSVTA